MDPVHQVEAALDAVIQQGRAPGLQYVVVDPTSILLEHQAGSADIAGLRPMRGGTTMMAYSMSKTITAAAVIQLVESKHVGLEDPIARYLDWQPYGREVTVRQLLSHTSGIPNPIPLRWVHPASAREAFNERAALMHVLEQHGRLAFAPGTKFAYSNLGYWLLGAIVERAIGEPFTTHVADSIIRPLGLGGHELGYEIADPAEHAVGYLEKWSMMNVIKRWLIDPALIGKYEGAWLQIRDHYVNGPAFGGLVGTATAFGRFMQDQLRDHSRLFRDLRARELLVQQQRTTKGTIPMTLGWHCGASGVVQYLFKEGGGGGFHCMMRLYPQWRIGTVLMANATGVKVSEVLDRIDSLSLRAFCG